MFSSNANSTDSFLSPWLNPRRLEVRFEVWTSIWFLAVLLSLLESKALNIDETAQLSRSSALWEISTAVKLVLYINLNSESKSNGQTASNRSKKFSEHFFERDFYLPPCLPHGSVVSRHWFRERKNNQRNLITTYKGRLNSSHQYVPFETNVWLTGTRSVL